MNQDQVATRASEHVALGVSAQGTRAVFITAAHRIVADVDTGQRRLVEVLRDPTRAFVDVTRLSLSRITEPTQLLATSKRGALRKTDIQLAAILSEAGRPERRLYAYVAKASVRVMCLLPSCEVIGDMHLPEGTTDGVVGYMKLKDAFIHLTDAQVRFTQSSVAPSAARTVVVNRSSVELLCLADLRLRDQDSNLQPTG